MPEAFANRGLAQLYLGRYEKAISDYTEVLRLKPDYAGAYNNRGLAKRELHLINEARQDFKKALKLALATGDTYLIGKSRRNLEDLDKGDT